jgi:hypothetical protein
VGEERDPTTVVSMMAVIAAALSTNLRAKGAPETPTHSSELGKAPANWKESQEGEFKTLWSEACEAEIEELTRLGAWEEVPKARVKEKLLPLKWVFTHKTDANGNLTRCKARICVRGDMQQKSDIEKTYAATLAARSFRIAIALAARFNLEIRQFDVKNAFLNALRGEDQDPIFCEMPPGYMKQDIALLLRKALYGLRDSPLLWFEEFSTFLAQLGLIQSSEEPCLYYNKARSVLIIVYVDDFLVFYHNNDKIEAEEIISSLMKKYKLHDQGEAEYFLGVKIIRDRDKGFIYLSQKTYIEKIANRFGIKELGTFPDIPIPIGELMPNEDMATKQAVKSYQEVVGSLIYPATITRIDISLAASKLARFLTNPSKKHWETALQAMRYLYLTRLLVLRFGAKEPAKILTAASDASYADDSITRKSSQGYVITLFGGPVVWKASRQPTVTTSTTEAELLALQTTAKEVMALQRMFNELQLVLEVPWVIGSDNQQTIRLVIDMNTRLATKLRHVDIHNMWIKQEYRKGRFEIQYIPTADMPADGLTKALPKQPFIHFRELNGLRELPKELSHI